MSCILHVPLTWWVSINCLYSIEGSFFGEFWLGPNWVSPFFVCVSQERRETRHKSETWKLGPSTPKTHRQQQEQQEQQEQQRRIAKKKKGQKTETKRDLDVETSLFNSGWSFCFCFVHLKIKWWKVEGLRERRLLCTELLIFTRRLLLFYYCCQQPPFLLHLPCQVLLMLTVKMWFFPTNVQFLHFFHFLVGTFSKHEKFPSFFKFFLNKYLESLFPSQIVVPFFPPLLLISLYLDLYG